MAYLIDANIFMYASGAEHPYKNLSAEWLRRVAGGDQDAVIDAEILQEILHRYQAIARWEQGREVYDLAKTIAEQVLPVTEEVMDQAKKLLDAYKDITARDAVHVAVCQVYHLEGIISFDRDFDRINEINRIQPG